MGQAKTLHIPLDTIDTISPSLPLMSAVPGSLNLHLRATLEPVCFIFAFNMCRNRHNIIVIIKRMARAGA